MKIKDRLIFFAFLLALAVPVVALQPVEIILGSRTIDGDLQLSGTTNQLILPQSNDAATPTLAFGDGDTGFYEVSDDFSINISLGGAVRGAIGTNGFVGPDASTLNGAFRASVAASATVPVFVPVASDLNSGVGSAGADQLSFIVGAIEGIRLTGDATDVLVAHEANVGLTADSGSVQGGGVITSSFNVYSTVGTTGDAATLPATFIVGTIVYTTNDGANSMDVFPASGDDAGSGAETAVAVAAGASALFLATSASATWTPVFNQ